MQYLLPNGRRQPVTVDLSDEVEEKASKIRRAGFVFEIEILRNGMVSATIGDVEHELDLAFVITSNGPNIVPAIERMIMRFNLDKPYNN